MSFRLWGFKPPREVASAFGSLESEVMEAVWQRGEVSVREVHVGFSRPVAYTTLMTTLDRLFKKGLLRRRKAGRAYVYCAAASRQELETSVAAELLGGLFSAGAGAAEPLLSSLVDFVGDRDRQLLDELDRLVREKRRRLRRSEPG